MKTDPIKFNTATRLWEYQYNRGKGSFRTKRECAKAYVQALISTEPKYKPLFEGKKWNEIFKILGITMERGQ